MKHPKADEIRLRYLYRRYVIEGGKKGKKIPAEAGRRLVGPDTAFHLYGGFSESGENKVEKQEKKRKGG